MNECLQKYHYIHYGVSRKQMTDQYRSMTSCEEYTVPGDHKQDLYHLISTFFSSSQAAEKKF